MKCSKCGVEFEGKFCPECGTPADGKARCPKCGAERRQDEKFCSECGYSYVQGQPVQTKTVVVKNAQTVEKPVKPEEVEKPKIAKRDCYRRAVDMVKSARILLWSGIFSIFGFLICCFCPIGYDTRLVNQESMMFISVIGACSLFIIIFYSIRKVRQKEIIKSCTRRNLLIFLGIVTIVLLAAISCCFMMGIISSDFVWTDKEKTMAIGLCSCAASALVSTICFIIYCCAEKKVRKIYFGKGRVKKNSQPRLEFTQARAYYLAYKEEKKAYKNYRIDNAIYRYQLARYRKKKPYKQNPSRVLFHVVVYRVSYIILACFLLISIITTCVTVSILSSPFRIGKVERIYLGSSKSYVREVLGEPSEEKDSTWEYYEDDYYDAVGEKESDTSLDDIEDFGDILNEIGKEMAEQEAQKEKLKGQTFKKITVNFEKKEEDWKVSSVWLDLSYRVYETRSKTLSSVAILSGEIGQFTTAESFPITYEAEYTDGSYVKAGATAQYSDTVELDFAYWEQMPEDTNLEVQWSNTWCEKHKAKLPVKERNPRWVVNGSILYYRYTPNTSGNASGIGVSDELKSQIEKIIIKKGVTSIPRSYFAGFTAVTEIEIPDSVTSIGDGAFYNCSGIIQKENGVSYVDKWIIDCDESVTSVTLRANTVGIAGGAFYNCSRLTSITIPNSVTSIGEGAFNGCSGLTGELVIPDSVTSIGSSAFEGCSGIIQKEGGVSYVDKWIIDCDESVTSVTLRANAVGIAGRAFYYCSGLTSIVIPDSVTSIGGSAFYNCSGLTSITIPNSVTSIGSSAFDYCIGLTKVNYTGTIDEWASKITFENSSANPLYSAGQLYLNDVEVTQVNLTTATKINAYAFVYCSGLTSIVIPDSVTSIGDFAFYNCSGLTSITYQGTKEQWNAIEKDSRWNNYTGDYTVYCTDGNI